MEDGRHLVLAIAHKRINDTFGVDEIRDTLIAEAGDGDLLKACSVQGTLLGRSAPGASLDSRQC